MTNQCVICGASMPEGDQVCRECLKNTAVRIDSTSYHLILNWRGEVFEVPSTDWLREAIREKREREARP